MWLRCLFAGAVACAVGCGGPRLAPVSGKVTLDGAPLAGATVSFYPLNVDPKQGPDANITSTGITDDKGEYTLETLKQQSGALVGKHRVSVTRLAVQADDGDARPKRVRSSPTMNDLVPPKYQGKDSVLNFEVKPGDNRADFELKSKP